VADAQRRAARWKAKPARAGRREQRAERRRRYSPMFWRSAARIRRERSESALQPNFGISICVGCASGENDNPAVNNQPPRSQAAEVVFEPGPASHRDVVEFLVQIRRPDLGARIGSGRQHDEMTIHLVTKSINLGTLTYDSVRGPRPTNRACT